MSQDRRSYDELQQAGELLPCQIAIEVKDIRAIRDEFGKALRDLIHGHFARGLFTTLGEHAWRLYQYEFVAEAEDEAAAHRAMGRLAQWLRDHPVLARRPAGPDLALSVGFCYSVGASFRDAYPGVSADRHRGVFGAAQVMVLPDGTSCSSALTPPSRPVVLTHPDAETRDQRSAHRYCTERPPRGLQLQQPDGSFKALDDAELDDFFESLRDRDAACPRWAVPWRAVEVRPRDEP